MKRVLATAVGALLGVAALAATAQDHGRGGGRERGDSAETRGGWSAPGESARDAGRREAESRERGRPEGYGGRSAQVERGGEPEFGRGRERADYTDRSSERQDRGYGGRGQERVAEQWTDPGRGGRGQDRGGEPWTGQGRMDPGVRGFDRGVPATPAGEYRQDYRDRGGNRERWADQNGGYQRGYEGRHDYPRGRDRDYSPRFGDHGRGGDRYAGLPRWNERWDHDRHRRDDWRAPQWRRSWYHGWNGHRWRAPTRYYYPSGYSYRRWTVGLFLPQVYWSDSWYLDYRYYGLSVPPYGCRWIRVDGDVLLIDLVTGEIVDALYRFFY